MFRFEGEVVANEAQLGLDGRQQVRQIIGGQDFLAHGGDLIVGERPGEVHRAVQVLN